MDYTEAELEARIFPSVDFDPRDWEDDIDPTEWQKFNDEIADDESMYGTDDQE